MGGEIAEKLRLMKMPKIAFFAFFFIADICFAFSFCNSSLFIGKDLMEMCIELIELLAGLILSTFRHSLDFWVLLDSCNLKFLNFSVHSNIRPLPISVFPQNQKITPKSNKREINLKSCQNRI